MPKDIKIRPEWLQELWELDSVLATNAEKYLDELGADIRNKLTPPKNLLALLKECKIEHNHSSVEKLVEMEMKNVEKSVDYLKNIL